MNRRDLLKKLIVIPFLGLFELKKINKKQTVSCGINEMEVYYPGKSFLSAGTLLYYNGEQYSEWINDNTLKVRKCVDTTQPSEVGDYYFEGSILKDFKGPGYINIFPLKFYWDLSLLDC
jgi:hypothetical protein